MGFMTAPNPFSVYSHVYNMFIQLRDQNIIILVI